MVFLFLLRPLSSVYLFFYLFSFTTAAKELIGFA